MKPGRPSLLPKARPRVRRKNERSRGLLATLLCIVLCALWQVSFANSARAADVPTRVVVEIDDPAKEKVDAKLVRRLIRLELADVTIPAPYDAPLPNPAPPLYVRIVAQEGYVSVELWERGLLRGERRVSLRAGTHVTARSIALVVAELSQRLADRRRAEGRAAASRDARARRASLTKRGQPLFARFAFGAAVEGATLLDDTWLAGPGVEGSLRFDNHVTFSLLTRGFTGRYENGALQWAELGVSPGYTFQLSKRWSLDAHGFATAASLTVPGALTVDGSQSSSTWSGRAGLGARLARRLWSGTEAQLALRAGSTLRKVPLLLDSGQEAVLGGPWFGIELGFTLDHTGPG